MEQSSDDLRKKLISMRVAQALQESQTPNYADKTFFYEPANWKDKTLRQKIETYNKGGEKLLPLYAESNEKQRTANDDLHDDLVKQLIQRYDKDGDIQICDSKTTSGGTKSYEPFTGSGSRVIMASRILEAPTTKAAKIGPHGRDELPVVVLDGLSLLSTSDREILEVQTIVEHMRDRFQLGILVFEPNEDKTSSLDHHTDMVIDLVRHTIERPLSYLIHELTISKARYQDSALGNHQFKIRKSGLVIFPSLHFQIHHYNNMELELKRSSVDKQFPPQKEEGRRDEKNGSLIDMLVRPRDQESIALLGPRNCFKTELSLDFLARGNWGAKPTKESVESGLLISLIDNSASVEKGLKCPHGPCKNCTNGWIKHARSFCQRPGYITPAEFFYYVQKRIAGGPQHIKRIAFWDLTQMDYRFPLFKADKMFLPALKDMFKTNNVKSLFVGAGNAENTQAASAMAVHTIFCWRSLTAWKTNPLNKLKKRRPGDGKTESSLMLFVDRTSSANSSSGRALCVVPILNDDSIDWPENPKQLKKLYRPLSEFMRGRCPGLKGPPKHTDDIEEIKRITKLQGVG
ncbi:MAG: hypothetical protein ACXWKG_00455 [Limisphaerales bacterium]